MPVIIYSSFWFLNGVLISYKMTVVIFLKWWSILLLANGRFTNDGILSNPNIHYSQGFTVLLHTYRRIQTNEWKRNIWIRLIKLGIVCSHFLPTCDPRFQFGLFSALIPSSRFRNQNSLHSSNDSLTFLTKRLLWTLIS